MEVYVMERKQNMAENESVENKKSKNPDWGKKERILKNSDR